MDSTPLTEPIEVSPIPRLAKMLFVPILIVVLMPFVFVVIAAVYVIATLERTAHGQHATQ